MKYEVTLKAEGFLEVIVEAKNLDDAKKQASQSCCDVYCGILRNIDWEACKVKNLETEKTYYL